MKHFLLTVAALVLATGSLCAQGFGGGMMMGANGGQTIMVNTAKGLFALRAGVLVKFNAATLKPTKVLEVFGPAPAQPAQNAEPAAMQKYFTEMQRRRGAAVMLAKDSSLLIVVGDRFTRINQDTLKVEAKADLSAPGTTTTGEAGRQPRMAESAPGYSLVGNTLYLMRSREILSISITNGKILTRAALPKQLQPAQPTVRAGAGGGGARGNRGGGGQ